MYASRVENDSSLLLVSSSARPNGLFFISFLLDQVLVLMNMTHFDFFVGSCTSSEGFSTEQCKKCRFKRLTITSVDHKSPNKRLKLDHDVGTVWSGKIVNTAQWESSQPVNGTASHPSTLSHKENLDPAVTTLCVSNNAKVSKEYNYVDDNESIASSEGGDSIEELTLAEIMAMKMKHCENEEITVKDTKSNVLTTNPVTSNYKADQLDQQTHQNFNGIQHVENHQNANNASLTEKEIIHLSQINQGDAKICFICGHSFDRVSTGFKGRLNHLKRCSKSNGVTALLLRKDLDMEEFQSSPIRSTTVPNNPYNRVNTAWHPGALKPLQAAGKQTLMSSFVQVPVKTINSVLMAGAKRIAKSSEIISAAAKMKLLQKSSKKSWAFSRRKSEPCPFYKKIPGTDFVCDGFAYARSSLTKNYFLTHFHSDHYGGIERSWNEGVIYCSLATANLVAQQLGVDKKYLHPLEMNTPIVIESQGKPITITLYDANHCPGAVMFLFQVGKRNILHVGDFRWHRDRMCTDLKHIISGQSRLDDLFLDTTYCNEKYCLPTQEDAIAATVAKAEEEVMSCRRSGKRLLMLFGAYTIGKERIYLAVAEKLGMKIYVDSRRFRILKALNWPAEKIELLTTCKEQSCLWVVPLGHINFKNLASYAEGSCKNFGIQKFDKIVGFRPTGWAMTGCKDNSVLTSRTSGIITVHGVPYSEHSSFSELVDCIDCLKPKRIIPTVSVSKSDEQVALLLKQLKNTI